MPHPGILLHPLSSSSIITRPSNSIQFLDSTTRRRRRFLYKSVVKCKAASNSFSVTDFDLYDLLGIDNTSNQSQIKTAYRSLQKRCHPDIAGPDGHEMAIILNDVYSILSDPVSRSAYDEEQAKMAEFRGYSGKPIYSTWFGSENEERAVFVDEVKCVGCLKCALLAEKTFAIESVYGRARVVAQWADPEDKILDAIQACPVDCISMVDRSNLAALEFLMSKQPRGKIGTTSGRGMTDIKKFQSKLQKAKDKDPTLDSRETAFHAVRSISNWFYWQSPKGGGGSLIHIAGKRSQFNTNKLRDAADAARQGFWASSSSNSPRTYNNTNDDNIEYYWTPSSSAFVPESSVFDNPNPKKPAKESKRSTNNSIRMPKIKDDPWSLRRTLPVGIATVAAVVIRLQGGGGGNLGYDGGVEQHMAGPLPLEIVNSSWLPTLLAGFIWYLIGIVSVELVRAIISRPKN